MAPTAPRAQPCGSERLTWPHGPESSWCSRTPAMRITSSRGRAVSADRSAPFFPQAARLPALDRRIELAKADAVDDALELIRRVAAENGVSDWDPLSVEEEMCELVDRVSVRVVALVGGTAEGSGPVSQPTDDVQQLRSYSRWASYRACRSCREAVARGCQRAELPHAACATAMDVEELLRSIANSGDGQL